MVDLKSIRLVGILAKRYADTEKKTRHMYDTSHCTSSHMPGSLNLSPRRQMTYIELFS